MFNWLCLPLNVDFNIQGKYSSDKSMTLQVSVLACDNNTDPNRLCADQAEIDQYFLDQGQVFFTIYFTNTIINAGEQ